MKKSKKPLFLLLLIVGIILLAIVLFLFVFNGNDELLPAITIGEKDAYVDNSGASAPVLSDGLIPVTIADDGTVTYADFSKEWYNYDEKIWANSVILKSDIDYEVGSVISEYDIAAYFVWIPRFKYELFSIDGSSSGSGNEQTINIEFESVSDEKSTGNENTQWYTHPAFTFGDDELPGIWVAKFEISGSVSNTTVLPSRIALVSKKVSIFYDSLLDFSDDHNIDADSHMIKNTEWGAIAYLSYSDYGINEEIRINNNNDFITGCGASSDNASSSSECSIEYGSGVSSYPQSTTGNISGIFDMAGGAFEYTMSNMQNEDGEFNSGSAGFTDSIDNEYYNSYEYQLYYDIYTGYIIGDATYETKNWFNDSIYFVNGNYPWALRGGSCSSSSLAGIFAFGVATGTSGSNATTRLVIIDTTTD